AGHNQCKSEFVVGCRLAAGSEGKPMLEHELLVRPLAAVLAGALVGLARCYRGRPAGLRPYALLCMGSALLIALAEELSRGPAGGLGDSTRVIQGIVTGIGFLGAGVIVKGGD